MAELLCPELRKVLLEHRAGLAVAVEQTAVVGEIAAVVRRPLAGAEQQDVAWERALGINLDGAPRHLVAQALLGPVERSSLGVVHRMVNPTEERLGCPPRSNDDG